MAQQPTDNTVLSGDFCSFLVFLRIDLPVIMCRKSICCCQSNSRTKLGSVSILHVFEGLSAQMQLAAICRWKSCWFLMKSTFYKACINIFFGQPFWEPPITQVQKAFNQINKMVHEMYLLGWFFPPPLCSGTRTFLLFCCLPAGIWRQQDR